MIEEARILAAFWQPKSKRFCELTAGEIRERTGMTTDCSDFAQLTKHKVIVWQALGCGTGIRVYRLSAEGQRRVGMMLGQNSLPATGRKLTAIPQEMRK